MIGSMLASGVHKKALRLVSDYTAGCTGLTASAEQTCLWFHWAYDSSYTHLFTSVHIYLLCLSGLVQTNKWAREFQQVLKPIRHPTITGFRIKLAIFGIAGNAIVPDELKSHRGWLYVNGAWPSVLTMIYWKMLRCAFRF